MADDLEKVVVQKRKGLIIEFGARMEDSHQTGLAFGRIISDLMDTGMAIIEVSKELRETYPNARRKLHYELTKPKCEELLLTHKTFVEGGGIETRDGKWSVSGEELEQLGFTDGEAAKVAEAIRSQKLPVKRLKKAAKVASRKGVKADVVIAQRNDILQRVGAKQALAMSPDEQLVAAKRELDLATKNLKRAQDRLNTAKKALKSAETAVQTEEKAEKAPTPAPKPSPRKNAQGSRNGATASTPA
jgi:uncharacterized protein YoaH (UPF0181 family)